MGYFQVRYDLQGSGCGSVGLFRHQRSSVRNQSLANFYVEHLLTVNCIEKIITKKKRSVLAHLKIIRGPTNQTTKLLRIIGKWSVLLLNS